MMICKNGCNLCYLCVNKIEGLNLIVLCPNEFCDGKFLSDDVKKKKNDEGYLKILEKIESDKNDKEKLTVKESNENVIADTNCKIDIDVDNKIKDESQVEFVEEEIKITDKNKKINWPSKNFVKPYSNLNYSIPTNIVRENNNFSNHILEEISPIAFKENFSPFNSDKKNLIQFNKDELCDSQAKKSRISYQSNISMASKPISNFSKNSTIRTSYKKSLDCPACGNKITLSDGKNLVSCQSPFCQGKNSFCKLCNEKVDIKNFHSHYPKGLYINKCIGIINHIDKSSFSNSIGSIR